MLMVSSKARSLEDLFELLSVLSVLSVPGNGGGEVEGRGGVADRRDFFEFRDGVRDEVRDGVRYGVSAGVGNAAAECEIGASVSSSVSHKAMLSIFVELEQTITSVISLQIPAQAFISESMV